MHFLHLAYIFRLLFLIHKCKWVDLLTRTVRMEGICDAETIVTVDLFQINPSPPIHNSQSSFEKLTCVEHKYFRDMFHLWRALSICERRLLQNFVLCKHTFTKLVNKKNKEIATFLSHKFISHNCEEKKPKLRVYIFQFTPFFFLSFFFFLILALLYLQELCYSFS